MKEILIGFAEYNLNADKKLMEILKSVDASVLKEDQGSYYKSILGTLEHIIGGALGSFRRSAGLFAYKCLAANPLIVGDLDALKKDIHDNPAAVYELLAKVDALFVEFAHELDPKDLPKRVSFKNYKGETLERAYWNTIFHILNHATHHRGEISALLDRKGVSNDFSGFNSYMK
jgi:uncharacterized damage-inducible protein DinB